jgi:hypothetical protein
VSNLLLLEGDGLPYSTSNKRCLVGLAGVHRCTIGVHGVVYLGN